MKSIGALKNLFHYLKTNCFLWLLLVLVCACHTELDQKTSDLQVNIPESGFIGSTACMSCHKEAYSNWRGSHHEQAMKIANSETILGDFNDVTFTSNNIKTAFFKKERDYYVNTQGEDGNYHDYKVKYTFGVTPLQQYIVQFPNGKFQCLQVAWDTKQNKWFDLQPDLKIKTDEWVHWTGGGMRWNTACADCHSTDLHKNFDSKLNTYNTTFSEINVGCEACHGPAEAHVKFYEKNGGEGVPPKMHMDGTLSSMELVDKCARCHSRRSQITKVFDYKGSFLDHYNPSLLVAPFYELDGQIKDEDYVYSSFIQSKMYHNGVSCKDCHDVHSLKLKETGNALCLSCHRPSYDTPSHHFHKENSKEAQCVNCHMTGKTYMGNDFRRDHSFRVPRPDQTMKYGTPNACNNCHKDKSPEWASKFINSKYGTKRADHFSDHLLAGYHGDKESLYKLIAGTNYPNIARATALREYSNQSFSQKEINAIIEFLKDSSTLVKNETVNALNNLSRKELSEFIEPLLLDSIRLVRISAVRYYNMLGITPVDKTIFNAVQKEYLTKLEMNADFASGQHQIALYQQATGNIEEAIKAYKKAIDIDNYYNMSRMNLALILYEQGKVKEAEKQYLKVTELEPDFGYSYYMLGLLYHETGNSTKALKYLAEACDKEPANVKAFYNYALKLQEVGKNEESIQIIDKALTLFPNNENFLYVKLLGQLNSNQHDASYITCVKILEIAPNNPNYLQIMNRLKQKKQ